jgi:membrane associated rhomboid family serine protease
MAVVGLLAAWACRWGRQTPLTVLAPVLSCIVLTGLLSWLLPDVIDHAGHLGGFGAGVALGAVLGRPWPNRDERPLLWGLVDAMAIGVLGAGSLAVGWMAFAWYAT